MSWMAAPDGEWLGFFGLRLMLGHLTGQSK
jgi:hypothetical protein